MKQKRKFLTVVDYETEALRVVKLERGATYDSVLTPYEDIILETKSHSKAVRCYKELLLDMPEELKAYYVISDNGFDGLRLDRVVVCDGEQWEMPYGTLLITEDYFEAKKWYDETLAERLADVEYLVVEDISSCTLRIARRDGTERYAEVVSYSETIIFQTKDYEEAENFYEDYLDKLKADVEYLVVEDISTCTYRIVSRDGTETYSEVLAFNEHIIFEPRDYEEAKEYLRGLVPDEEPLIKDDEELLVGDDDDDVLLDYDYDEDED